MTEPGAMNKRIKTYFYIILALLGMLGIKLAVVQLFYNEVYQTKARDNRVRILPVLATRGEILTSDEVLLASNELVYTVSLSSIGNSLEAINALAAILNPGYPDVTTEYIKEQIDKQKYRQYEPAVIRRNISWETVVQLEENRQFIPGLSIEVEPLRSYPAGALAGHILGYVHSISAEEVEEKSSYSMNSLIGKSGVEKQYEDILHGLDGARQVEVDARGRPIGELVTLDPVSGSDVYLTIDTKLQTVLENSMQELLTDLQKRYPKAQVASAVLLEVDTGRVLAMASKPDLYPDDFKGNLSLDRASYYFPQGSRYDPLSPGATINRAIQSTYPPGSSFKPITAMAALEKGVADPLKDFVNCAGRYWIAPYIVCTGVHGNVNLYSGMATSCNVYFQEIGRRATKDELIRVAKEFGLDQKSGIDLPFEVKGLVPTPEWKKEVNSLLLEQRHANNLAEVNQKYDELIKLAQGEEKAALEKEKAREIRRLEDQLQIDYRFDTNWQEYDTYNMSIGQGANNYTVIGLANYVATLANGGRLMQPYLVEKLKHPDGSVTYVYPKRVSLAEVSARTLEETRQAMARVTQPGGTASFLFTNFPAEIKVAAKTGTAQTGRIGDNVLGEFHGTFVAFAPVDDPKIAFAGVVEYGQHGSSSAGLVCKAVFEQYFGIVDHYGNWLEQNAAK